MYRLVLRGFKGVVEGEIDLGRANILLGANNSGKSTVLEALLLLFDPLRFVPYASYSSSGMKELNALELLHELHKTLFSEGYIFLLRDYRASSSLVSLSGDVGERRLELLNETHTIMMRFVINEGLVRSVRLSKFSNNFTPRAHSEVLEEDCLYFHPSLVNYAWFYFSKRWAEISGPELASEVTGRLKDVLGEEYVDLTMEPFGDNRMTLYIYLKGGRRIRLGDFGDGFKTVLTLMTLYRVVRPKWVLIDDVESHMNPRLLTFLAQWLLDLVNEGVNLVITTHSLEAAKLIGDVLEDVDPKFILTGLSNGKLRTKTFNLRDIDEIEKAGLDLRVGEGTLL